MFGLKQEQIAKMINVFSQFPEIEEVIIYGSRAKGNYRSGSDIDLTLKGSTLNLNLLFKIENALDDILLPYFIDLSIYHTLNNPDLVNHIDRVGCKFYSKTTPTS